MTRVPYEVIEFREHKALAKEYSWKSVAIYFLYFKSAATILGIAASCGFYGLTPSWSRNIFFWRYEVCEALSWIPMVIGCAIAEYTLIVLRVHKKMGVILKGRTYYRAETI